MSVVAKSDPRTRNRRRHARAEVPATAILFTERRPIGPCLIDDLSTGGVRLTAGSPVRRGRVISVMLDLPSKEPFVTFAQVSRSEKKRPGEYLLALAFVDLPRSAAERLEQVVARLLAEKHPCLEFFDTADDGRPKRIILPDGSTPLVT